MKKLFISAGLMAAGVAGVHAAYAPGLNSMETSKIWSLSGTLRGFYDDNYTTAHSNKRSSFGFEASPSFSLNLPLQQTELGLRYTYGLYYYQDREDRGQNPIDQTHQADLWVDHAFTERWQAKVKDSFVVAQEPQLITPGTVSNPERVKGNNIRNTGTVSVHTDWTEMFSTDVGYNNNFYDYQNHGYTGVASLSGALDRLEHLIWLNANWQLQPETMLLVGYQYGQVNYIGNELISPVQTSSSRDNRSHYGYVGAQHSFTENLSGTVKAGVQYVDYYNDSLAKKTQWSPYADVAATYTYAPGSYVQVGFTQSRNATDVTAVGSDGATLDQESSVIYASINHQITPNLLASLVGHWQYSTFHSGAYDGNSDIFYNLGLNLSYAFNTHISADIGYNFDYLTSDVPNRGYTRNRGYIGLTATY